LNTSTYSRTLFLTLERRVLMCGQHVSAAEAARLNALPIESPEPFGVIDHNRDHADEASSQPLAPPATSTTIINNGAPSNRIDMVLVGDGYTTADMATYSAHAQAFASSFFNEFPLSTYKPLFNVHRVDVISNQSGVDNDPNQGILRDTALDMNFWCSGIERLLCVNTSKAASYAVNAPQVDQTVAIANSTKYGGAGYLGAKTMTYSGGNSSSLEVARHEFGHSFANLADEYDYADGATYAGTEPSSTNISKLTAAQMASAGSKWSRWLDLPDVDAFQGAGYYQFGLYRPTTNSKMRNLFRPWDAVNAEQIIIKLYEQIDPIDASTPAGTYSINSSFFVDPIDPVGNPMSIQWHLDGSAIAGATGLTFDAASLNLSGNHTLSVSVRDTTTAVRDPAAIANHLTQLKSWTLLDTVAPLLSSSTFSTSLPSPTMRLNFNEPVTNPAGLSGLTLTNLTTNTVVPNSQLAITLEANQQTARLTYTGNPQGILPDGRYRMAIAAGSFADTAGNGVAASTQALEFRFVQGDANDSGAVEFGDLLIVAQSFGLTGRTFATGDFDFDADVDFNDLLIIAQRFGNSVSIRMSTTPVRPIDDGVLA
jgi:hypothetical protein